MQGIGSRNVFSSSTQDCANRFAAATQMYGFPFFQPFVDLDHVECMLVVGTNPVVSKWTFLQVAHPIKRLKEVKARGGRIIVIDPRHTETARVAGEHVFIKPNADVFFFLAFLQEIFATGRYDEAQVRQHSSGIDELRAAVADWTRKKPPRRPASPPPSCASLSPRSAMPTARLSSPAPAWVWARTAPWPSGWRNVSLR